MRQRLQLVFELDDVDADEVSGVSPLPLEPGREFDDATAVAPKAVMAELQKLMRRRPNTEMTFAPPVPSLSEEEEQRAPAAPRIISVRRR